MAINVTSSFASVNVHGIITRAVVCNPFHRCRQTSNQVPIEDPDLLRGLILSVNAYGVFILPAWFEASEEGFAVRRIEELVGRKIRRRKEECDRAEWHTTISAMLPSSSLNSW